MNRQQKPGWWPGFSLRPGFFRGKIGKNGVRSQKDGKRIGARPVISGQEK